MLSYYIRVEMCFDKDRGNHLMIVFFGDSLESLESFACRPSRLAIFEREKPAEAGPFFARMASTSFGIAGEVSRRETLADIEFLLEEGLSIDVQRDPFYKLWLKDMARVCSLFCEVEQNESI